jgi:hypothetical protein
MVSRLLPQQRRLCMFSCFLVVSVQVVALSGAKINPPQHEGRAGGKFDLMKGAIPTLSVRGGWFGL